MASSFAFLLTSLLLLPAALSLDAPVWDYFNRGPALLREQVLTKGQYLQSENCKFQLQFDCSLALYDFTKSSKPTWQPYIANGGYGVNCELKLKSDGNLVLFKDGNINDILWESKTSTSQYSYPLLILQDDCNAVVYGAWAGGKINN
ncbi:Lectin [Rhynchospora pubera]|uniref:non-specific serine/threonine protein kinase n=1 Tax=Rhynchospora pubera TaxID=906938 RepID=A0AAV8H0Y3_9POAL|nr:Lectin [Rhynchospora pubera]